jgi:hypothetical protein
MGFIQRAFIFKMVYLKICKGFFFLKFDRNSLNFVTLLVYFIIIHNIIFQHSVTQVNNLLCRVSLEGKKGKVVPVLN